MTRYKTEQRSRLTKKQGAIVKLDLYPHYLRAGAGTGKTEVLIQKILHILRHNPDVSLRNFGIITFTNKATDEMRGRLSSSLYTQWLADMTEENPLAEPIRKQAEIINMVDICTIHVFCERLLRKYGLHIGVPLNFKIKSFRHETSEIITGVVARRHDNGLLKGIPQYRMCKLLDILLSKNSNQGSNLTEKLREHFADDADGGDYWQRFKTLYLELYFEAQEQIEARKREQNVLTPNDLVHRAVELLNHGYVTKKIAEQYKYLFMDEFQDTNKDQFHFVNILISKGVKVFLVGDDKQSVYAFRGADIENSRAINKIVAALTSLFKKKPEPSTMYLDENFRSDGKLLTLFNRMFAHGFTFGGERIHFPVEPFAIEDDTVGLNDCLEITFGRTVEDIIRRLLMQTINGKAVRYSDIAILCRRNFDLDRIAQTLKRSGFPVEVVGGKGFYKSKEVIDTYKLFNAVLNRDDKYRNELRFTDYHDAIHSNTLGLDYNGFLYELETVFRYETVEEILSFIYDKSYIEEYYRSKQNYQAVHNLHKLKDIARGLMNHDNMQPLQFLEYLQIMISTGQEEDEADISESERERGMIRLYSIHKAKGLEFPVVIVPNIDNKLNRPITKPKVIFEAKDEARPVLAFDNESVNPNLAADEDYIGLVDAITLEHLEEEVRIFYVAATRAQHKLILVGSRALKFTQNKLEDNSFASVAKWLLQMEDGRLVSQYKPS